MAILARRFAARIRRWAGLVRRTIRLLAVVSAFACITAYVSEGAAQDGTPPPPTHFSTDANGVDLVTGAFHLSGPSIAIGQPGAGGLVFARSYDSSAVGWRGNLDGAINSSGSTYTVTLLGEAQKFTLSGSSFTPAEGQSSSLVNSGGGVYTFTTSSGAVALYSTSWAGVAQPAANVGRVTSITYPSGEQVTFTYESTVSGGYTLVRLMSVNNSFGYQIKFEYNATTFLQLYKVTAINSAIDYCSPTMNGCSGLTQVWPSLTYSNSWLPTTVTDAANRTTNYTYTNNVLTAIRWPSSGTNNITISYTNSLVNAISNGAGTWAYLRVDNGSTRTTTITDPLSHQRVVVSNTSTNRVTSDADALSRTTSFQYDSVGRMTRMTLPEGNANSGYVQYTYDVRGNITETRQVSKTPGTPADIVTSATYVEGPTVTTCTNPRTCNQPASITANGVATSFAYDSTHGGVLTATQPAVGGVSPQTRFTYAQRNAWYRTSSSPTQCADGGRADQRSGRHNAIPL